MRVFLLSILSFFLIPVLFAQTTPLNFRPIASEYNEALDRIIFISANPNVLRIYNPANHTQVTVALPSTPTSLSIGPTGAYAAVGHLASVSIVNLAAATLDKTVNIPLHPIVLAAEYIHSLVIKYGETKSYRISDGVSSTFELQGLPFPVISGERLHPSGKAIYGTRSSIVNDYPNLLQRFDVSTGPITARTYAPYDQAHPACGRVWFSPSGDRIYNGCPTIYRYSTDPNADMTYLSEFPGVTGIVWLHDSAEARTIAVIPGNPEFPPVSTNDHEILLYQRESLTLANRLVLSDFFSGGARFKAHGRAAFFNNSGDKLFAVAQADTSSGLVNDFALETFPLTTANPCVATFNTANATSISQGMISRVGIATLPDCRYQAVTTAPWIALLEGASGRGDGVLNFLVRPNPTFLPRTATISVGGQSIRVDQDPAPSNPGPVQRLAYKIVDAEYSKGLDRLIFVSSPPQELHIYDPATFADQFVALAASPRSVSVRPDGLFAAVGHDRMVSYVNLQTAAIERTFPIPSDIGDVVLASNGFLYVLPSPAASVFYAVELATGTVTTVPVSNPATIARLHPNQRWLYFGNDATKWDALTKVPSPSQNESRTCGNLWLTEDGNQILTACGAVLETAADPANDMRLIGNLTQMRWAHHSSQRRSTVLIPDSGDYALYGYGDDLLFSGRHALPGFPSGGSQSSARAVFSFWDAAASRIITIIRADPAAGLLSDFAVYVAPLNAAGCQLTFSQRSSAVPSTSQTGQFSVISGDCAWGTESSSDWVTIEKGRFGFGSGVVRFSVSANSLAPDRTATIAAGNQIYTIRQAGTGGVTGLSPTFRSIGSEGGSGAFSVIAADSSIEWSATTDASWIAIPSPAGKGGGQVTYQVSANPSLNFRMGEIIVAGRIFSITQGGNTHVTISPSSATFSAMGGSGTIQVTPTSSVFTWGYNSNEPWIVMPRATRTGDATLSYDVLANPGQTPRTGVISVYDKTFTVTQQGAGPASPLRFIPITPCRVVDTRESTFPTGAGTPVLSSGQERSFPIQNGRCGPLTGAAAYSMNVTVVPRGALSYLTIWPAGQARPLASTLNSFDGRVKANAAIVPAGANGNIAAFATDTTDVIIDINGYFVPITNVEGLSFYPVVPCRVADTRSAAAPLGGPALSAGQVRSLPVLASSCAIPSTAKAYSLNMTTVPARPLSYLTTWPTGSPQPFVSTLNAPTGTVVANAAIMPAGTGGNISVFATDPAEIIIDINGYFAPPGAAGALSFYPKTPCRISDTRDANGPFGGPILAPEQPRNYGLMQSACSVPANAKAVSLSATVVPPGPLSFLTIWPSDQARPLVSTLNAFDGSVTSNAVIAPIPVTGIISTFATHSTHLILDINGYFAP